MGRIVIDSILGGQSPSSHFGAKNQFRASLGIDPSLPITDSASLAIGGVATGLLRPVGVSTSTSTTTSGIMWIRGSRSTTSLFVTDLTGSAYVVDNTGNPPTITALADGGSLSSGIGNGLEYNDNYLYIAKNTDIARFGPLNTADPVFDGSYWQTTLGKAALTNTTYPAINQTLGGFLATPNHYLHRHSDGKLYIADVQSDQGVISYISTKKTTQEGDTDNGSTASALTFGYGLHPTAIESYGSNIAVALFENDTKGQIVFNRVGRAKLAFWDTVSQNFNSIIWVEFPDPIITAMKNVDGVLYVVSGSPFSVGFRVSRFVGGYTFQEVYYSEFGSPCMPGALDGASKRLVIGSSNTAPESAGCVFSLGLQKSSLGQGLFNTFRVRGSTKIVTSLLLSGNQFDSYAFDGPVTGWYDVGNIQGGIDSIGNTYAPTSAAMWWSQTYKIGEPFEIKRIRIPMAQQINANTSITAKIYFDDGITSQTLPVINSTNFPNSAATAFGRAAVIKTAGDGSNIIRGQNNFWLELKWSSTGLDVVGLPILIDFDVIPD